VTNLRRDREGLLWRACLPRPGDDAPPFLRHVYEQAPRLYVREQLVHRGDRAANGARDNEGAARVPAVHEHGVEAGER
jgi:hypothetical protein